MNPIRRDFTAVNKRSGSRQVVGIVLHDTAGSGTMNDVRFLASDNDRGVSVDFCINRQGEIFQLSPDLQRTTMFHAGRSTKFRGLVNAAVNRGTIGIEIVQKADLSLSPLYPEAQVRSVAELCAHLCGEFGLTRGDITTHARIITDASRSDPRQFPFTKFDDIFNNAQNGGGGGSPVTHTVVAGDTLFALARRFETTIEEIKRLNGINQASNVIRVGQVLIIKP
jgi:N-acetyl-anhydromuramyl-L-alanine amidase AmpD